jgi:hypothetical protein
MRFLAAILPVLFLAAAPSAQLVVEKTDGPVTPAEIAAFKTYIKSAQYRGDNNHNNMVYGNLGKSCEALADMYEITHDRESLDELVERADIMLAGRNDPEKGRIIWTGQRELVWPNSPDSDDEYLYAGTENGDVIGHIANVARLILLDKSLATEKVPSEKLEGGGIYLDRAKKYVTECDKTIDSYLLPNLVDPQTNLYYSPTNPLYARLGEKPAKSMGKPVAWNQQMMLNHGFQRLAECHALLGDDPKRVARYDAIVKASCDAFLASLVHYDVKGHDCVKWSYAADDKTLHYMEDAAHGGYDLLIFRCYRSGRYGIKKEQLVPIANTIMYVMNLGDGTFATRVDGVSKKGPSGSLRATYLRVCEFVPDLWPIASKAALKRAKGDPLLCSELLLMKHYRNLGRFPSPGSELALSSPK